MICNMYTFMDVNILVVSIIILLSVRFISLLFYRFQEIYLKYKFNSLRVNIIAYFLFIFSSDI